MEANYNRTLNLFFAMAYLLTLAIGTQYLSGRHFMDGPTTLFSIAVLVTYGAWYLLPALAVTRLTGWVFKRILRPAAAVRSAYATAILATGATWVLLVADGRIFGLYGFHINGFVWNLVTTPGGIESMGMSAGTYFAFAALIGGLFLGAGALLWLARRFSARRSETIPRRRVYAAAIGMLLVLSLGERVAYGFSNILAYSPVLMASQAFPLYLPLTFRSFGKAIGLEPVRDEGPRLKQELTRLRYPLSPLLVEKPQRPLNVVWLVAESLRADMLNPEIMPASWRFAERAHRFTRHYSGGNSTREGVFSQFYGLYGSYWFPILAARQGPVLFDVLRDQGYQWRFFSSQKLSYPEFDQTVFVDIPSTDLQSYIDGPGWERDRKNVTDLLTFLEQRDPDRPFFAYMFFESPHARYYFPPESVIRQPYLEELNYATLSTDTDMTPIFNRYVNSVHHLDSQFARVLRYLEEHKLREDTIVLITGDHGEEFMENGHWGHGSTFSDPQTRVPLVLWIPGMSAGVVSRLTSHIDIIPTLLPRLGVKNPSDDYALGADLLGPGGSRYTIATHWHTLGYIGEDFKASFSMSGTALPENGVTTADDRPVADPSAFYTSHQKELAQVMLALSRFGSR